MKTLGLTLHRLALLSTLIATPVLANNVDALLTCQEIQDDQDRLRCYDNLAAIPKSSTAASAPAIATAPSTSAGADTPLAHTELSALSRHWEIDPESKRGLWSFQPHKPNYFLVGRYTDSVNQRPYDAYFNAVNDPNIGLDNTESKFQLSFKLKAAEDLFGRGVDLWLGYTQQNHWQVYNKDISAPFRETNYEPEVFVTIPVDYNFLGLRGRFVNFGFTHQSNGQSNLLSRSWNRIYAQAGFEYGDNFSLTVKPWYRLPEDADEDDNPNITDYMGDFEAISTYRLNEHTLSLRARSTFDLNRGFAQFDWSFPLHGKLKGYVQFTTGYGESLIDYDHRQSTIGVGMLLSDWL